MSPLLAPGQSIKLVRYADAGEAAAAAGQLQAIGVQAQTTAEGRARLALAMAFLNITSWAPTAPAPPDPADPDAVEAGQYGAEFGFPAFPIIPFTVTGRQQIELAAGGNSSWTKGVDFARELRRSPYLSTVEALYAKAGLDLPADLATLTKDADITADPAAVAWSRRYLGPDRAPAGPDADDAHDRRQPRPGDGREPVRARRWPGQAPRDLLARPTSRGRSTATSCRPSWWPGCLPCSSASRAGSGDRWRRRRR